MNRAITDSNWLSENQRYLMAAMGVVRAALEQHASQQPGETTDETRLSLARQSFKEAADSMSSASALESLCRTFVLTPFERDVLVLSAGVELDSSFGALCAAAQGDPSRVYPTFSLALAALSDPHWNALTPAAPLRHWRMIELGAGGSLTLSPLRIDERVLHFLAGTSHMDERLEGIVEQVRTAGDLVPSHAALADRIAATWSQRNERAALPAIQLCGDELACKRAIAVAACAALGLGLIGLNAQFIPTNPSELDAVTRLTGREAALNTTAILVDCDELDSSDAVRSGAVSRLIERILGPVIVTSRERRAVLQRQTIAMDVLKPSIGEQRDVWRRELGEAANQLNGQVDLLVTQFSLSSQRICAACDEATSLTAHDLWDACRAQARPQMNNLAQRIDPAASWDDLVLPEPQLETLREIASHVRHRAMVYDRWGFGTKGSRGLGISALFAGASGTGKTMAAEVLACELRLDLYRIDLSAVVSKYIGETEKNLRRVFDAAEQGGAVLLFDEADALFGKRSEVKDSHDRYANIEVSYLLQRMESYRGLAILTTNLKSALDSAFLRRIRFVVQFPFPDAMQRAEIWRRIFPSKTPTQGLDVNKLSRLNVAGGHIRNIAMNAAFLAADANDSVRMSHLLRAARSEYTKLEKPLTESEIGGWL